MVMDVPPDIQRWYQHMVEQQGMPEEHARMLVQDHLQERQAHADPRTEVAPWQKGPSQTDGPHNYFHQAHLHRPETSMIADDFWRAHGNPQQMTDVHMLRYNKHLVDEGMGLDAFQIHKKVPVDHQDKAIEHLTRPFAPRRDLNFVPAHLFKIPENMNPKPHNSLRLWQMQCPGCITRQRRLSFA